MFLLNAVRLIYSVRKLICTAQLAERRIQRAERELLDLQRLFDEHVADDVHVSAIRNCHMMSVVHTIEAKPSHEIT